MPNNISRFDTMTPGLLINTDENNEKCWPMHVFRAPLPEIRATGCDLGVL